MKVNDCLSAQCYNYQNGKNPSFKKLEKLEVFGLMEKDGEVAKTISQNIENAPFFKALCEEYDVILKIGTELKSKAGDCYQSSCSISYKPISGNQSSQDNSLRKYLLQWLAPFKDYSHEEFHIKSNDKDFAEKNLSEHWKNILDNVQFELLQKRKITPKLNTPIICERPYLI